MVKDQSVIIDTNVLLDNPNCISEYDNIILPISVLEEVDRHSHSSDEYLRYKARQIRNELLESNNIRWLLDKPTYEIPETWEYTYVDNKILAHCKDENAVLITNDINLSIKAQSIGVVCEQFGDKVSKDTYTGYKIVSMDDNELAQWYEGDNENKWNLKVNEYLLIESNGDIVERYKFTTTGFKHVSYKNIESRFVGKVKPRNLEQELYMDLLQDDSIKIKACTGFYGTGKDYLALANFLNLIEKGKYNKIIWVRNNIEAQGTKPIGYLPGTITEKLSVFADIVSDFIGDKIGFETLLNQGKIELVHTGFLRGRDLKNSIIYCTESQNMTKELVQLIIGRVADNSMLFFNGDIKQTDSGLFKSNNGLYKMIEKFTGNKNFGYVMLNKCERSEIAEMASLLE